jgi:hypothetical protein
VRDPVVGAYLGTPRAGVDGVLEDLYAAAGVARRTRRIKSSVLPENIEPVMTVRDPVLRVAASSEDSKVRVMARILPITRPFT